MDQSESARQRRREELMAQLGPILGELADLAPPDIVTLLLALPVDLAGYMAELAQSKGLELAPIYAGAALEGLLHLALHNSQLSEARRIAHLIERIADDEEWATFCERHPEVVDGSG